MISKLRKAKLSAGNIYHPINNAYERTKQNLALTPSDMAKMAANGIPISAQSLPNFYDGVPNPGYFVDLQDCRGVDAVAVWEASQDAKLKFKHADSRDRQMYDI